MQFFNRLNYSFGNEDWETEQKALQIRQNDRVLCITASGDRPLHLLLNDCAEIVALDANKIQNHLLTLKMAAMNELSYSDYLSFLGATHHPNRTDTFNKVCPSLDEESKCYWEQNIKSIHAGILYQGTVEKFTTYASNVVKIMRRNKVHRLFSFTNLEEQKDFLHKEWNTFFWKKCFAFILHPTVSRFLIRDPGLNSHVAPKLNVGEYFFHRINNLLDQYLARESTLLSLFLMGKVGKDAFPPYLKEAGYNSIKKHLGKITVQHNDLISYLENSPSNSFDKFSLSDVASYITPQEFTKLLQEVLRTAKPGARFSIRQFLSSQEIPPHLEKVFKRELNLEKQLENEDRCFVYRFFVGSIVK